MGMKQIWMLGLALCLMACSTGKKEVPADWPRKAREAMGFPASMNSLEVYAMADCSGPNSSFQTLLISNRSNTRFEQLGANYHNLSVHRPDSAWRFDFNANTLEGMDNAYRAFLFSHELHMVAIWPEARFGLPQALEQSEYGGKAAVRLEFIDAMDSPFFIYYDAQTHLPLGFTVNNHIGLGEGDVSIYFKSWQNQDGKQLFQVATFVQGDDEFRYDFTELDFNREVMGDFFAVRPLISR